MKAHFGSLAALLALHTVGCSFDCTRYSPDESVKGTFAVRESAAHRQAADAQRAAWAEESDARWEGPSTNPLTVTAPSSDVPLATAVGARSEHSSCSEMDCSQLTFTANDIELHLRQPTKHGEYELAALQAEVCERFAAPGQDDVVRCTPVTGKIFVKQVDANCNDHSGSDECTWLDAGIQVDEPADPDAASFAGSVHVVERGLAYHGTCGGFGSFPMGLGD